MAVGEKVIKDKVRKVDGGVEKGDGVGGMGGVESIGFEDLEIKVVAWKRMFDKNELLLSSIYG